MTSLKHKAEEVFAHDRYATEATGVVIDEVTAGFAQCSLTLQPRHRNAMGGVMGGVMFTLADLAFAAAANTDCLTDDKALVWVSMNSSIQYLSQPKGEQLIGRTTCVKQGRKTCVYTILIQDELNTPVALVTTTGMKIDK